MCCCKPSVVAEAARRTSVLSCVECGGARRSRRCMSCSDPLGTDQLPDSFARQEPLLRQAAAPWRSVSLGGERQRGSHHADTAIRAAATAAPCCCCCCHYLLLWLHLVPIYPSHPPGDALFSPLRERKRWRVSGAAWTHHSPRNDRDAGGIYPQEVRRLISSNYRLGQVLCDAHRPPTTQPSITATRTELRDSGRHT